MLHVSPDAIDERAAEVIRGGARLALGTLPQLADELSAEHLRAPGMERVAADPVLTAATSRAFLASLARWCSAVAERPWDPVPAADDDETVQMARDLVRRGLDDVVAVAYRVGQAGAWRRLVEITCAQTDDVRVVSRVLEHAARSMSDFVERTLELVAEVMRDERAGLERGDRPERRQTVALLLEGAPIPVDRASASLGIDLQRPHTAIVVWTVGGAGESSGVTEVVDLLVRSAASRAHLVTLPSRDTAWLWIPGPGPGTAELELLLRSWPRVRVAVGATDVGVEGFRAGHRSALSVQHLVSLSGLRQAARAEDTRLAALISRHDAEALDFARTVLGGLAAAPTEVLQTVRTYFAETGNISRTADRLFAHRNTVVRRLARADELLPEPLASRPLDVAAALEVWQWLGSDGRRGRADESPP